MLGVGANHHDASAAANNTAFFTNFADRGSNFHNDRLYSRKYRIVAKITGHIKSFWELGGYLPTQQQYSDQQ